MSRRNFCDDFQTWNNDFLRVDQMAKESATAGLPAVDEVLTGCMPSWENVSLEGLPPPEIPVAADEDKITLCGMGITRTIRDYDTIGAGPDSDIRVRAAAKQHCVFHDWNGKWFVQCPGGDGIRINNVECGREPGKMYRVKKQDVLIVAGSMFRIV